MTSFKKWILWILFLIVALTLLGVFLGGKRHDFIGITPLIVEDDKQDSKFTGEIPTVTPIAPSPPYQAIKSPHIIPPIVISPNVTPESIDSTPSIPSCILKSDEQEIKPGKKRMDSKGEQTCREVLEDIYKKPFPKIRPGFIRNPETQTLLELDGYNAETGIAFEYNGIQHYTWPNYTNQTYAEFVSQVRRDQYKLECCDRHNVYLITIPYNVPSSDIREFITYYLPENVSKRLQENNTE